MGGNFFGRVFRITTWGESHGPAIGVVIDGCPAGLTLDLDAIQMELNRRAPGHGPFRSPRKEPDQVKILSGLFEGKTTGAPIALQIENRDVKSSSYEPIKELLRPGHAQFAYLEKYGVFDHRGGGRASARETAVRVAAGAVAKAYLRHQGIEISAYLKQVGTIEALAPFKKEAIAESPIFCPDRNASQAMCQLLEKTAEEGDSLGGVVEFHVEGLPAGLGEPVFDKLPALLAHGLMSLPAAKGFEIGSGMEAAERKGSEHNDAFTLHEGKPQLASNHAGGTLGGISTGMPLVGRVAFKPPSSIRIPQETVTLSGEKARFQIPEGSRHDPCVAIRAVPVVEAMVALVLADAYLLNRMAKA